jgi:hypothetical protein
MVSLKIINYNCNMLIVQATVIILWFIAANGLGFLGTTTKIFVVSSPKEAKVSNAKVAVQGTLGNPNTNVCIVLLFSGAWTTNLFATVISSLL